MATKKISELEAITEADGSDVLAIVDVSEGKTNKITKNNLLKGSGHTIEMSLNENYQIVLKLKNAEGTELSTATIDLPNENAITNIEYSNGKLIITKQSGTTIQVDISGLINGLATETALTNLANALKQTIGIQTNTYDNTKTYNTGDIVVQNEKIYKANQDNITGTFDSSKWDEISLYEYQKLQDEAIEENYKVITKLQEDVEDLTERVEDAENNEITNTPTPATSHYLQDSADSRFRKFIPIGRTTQESTTGKNLAEPGIERTVNGVTFKNNTDGSTTLTGTSTGGVYNAVGRRTLPAGTYYCYVSRTSTSSNISYYLWDSDYQTIGQINQPFTLSEEKKVLIICGIENAGVAVNETVKAQIEPGNVFTGWEKYTGGEPAPNPNYPMAIKNTGDNGSVNEKVQNKNLIDVSYTKENPLNINGSFAIINLDLQADKVKNIIKAGDTIRLSCKAISNGGTITRSQLYLGNGTNTSYLPASMITITNQESTISNYGTMQNDIVETGTHQLMVVMYASSGENYKVYDFMLEKVESNGEVTYVPHEEQNPSFPLAQGQKFYEGSYPDDDEKVHHKRMQIVLDGSDDEVFDKHSDTNEIRYYLPRNMKLNGKIIANYFMQMKSSSDKNYVRAKGTEPVNSLMFKSEILNTDEMTIPEWRQYLSEHNLILEIDLAEEQTEDFTEEQQTAWEQIKKARTYKNVTHISSEDETPANVDITYVRDLETVINNLTTRVETIESEV